jgi:hypothetical protein
VRVLGLCLLLAVTGCADITVTQVNADGLPVCHAAHGLVVPRLMPYLLVAYLPADPAAPANKGSDSETKKPYKPKISKKNKDNAEDTDTDTADKPTTSGNAASASDLSFSATTSQYAIKLIYLPDYSHQQAIATSSGWFGKANLQVQLLDGTLVSLNGNTDNTENGEVAKAALSALVTAATGGQAAAPAAAAKVAGGRAKQSQPTGAGNPATQPPPAVNPILPSGLYKFEYNKDGVLQGLGRVTDFGTNKDGNPVVLDAKGQDGTTAPDTSCLRNQ